jgi:hypothetical protein
MGRRREISINQLRARSAKYGLSSEGSRNELEKRLIEAGLGPSDFDLRKKEIETNIENSKKNIKNYDGTPLLILDPGSYMTRLCLVKKGSFNAQFRSLIAKVKDGAEIDSEILYGDEVIKNLHSVKNVVSVTGSNDKWEQDKKVSQELILHGLKKFDKELKSLEVKLVILTGGNSVDKDRMEKWARYLRGFMSCEVLDVVYIDSAYASAYGTNQKPCSIHIEGSYNQTGVVIVTGSHEAEDILINKIECGGKDYNENFQKIVPNIPPILLDYLSQAWMLSESNLEDDFVCGEANLFPIELMKKFGITIDDEIISITRGRKKEIKEDISKLLKETVRTQAKILSYAARDLIDRLPYALMNTALANVYTGGPFFCNSMIREYLEEELDNRGFDTTQIYHVNDNFRDFRGVVNIMEDVS